MSSSSPPPLHSSAPSTPAASASGSMLTTPTSSSDACASIVNSLLHHRQGDGESESFSRSAINSLVKKLKEKRDELDALITAVTTSGATPTCCVTIPKTLDGRLQVASRKGFPHVIYAKIWRWPDLHKNELKQADFCEYGFDQKDKDMVCVNPYHYIRVIGPGIDLSGLTLGASAAAAAAASGNWAAFGAGNGGSWSAGVDMASPQTGGYSGIPLPPEYLPMASAARSAIPAGTNGAVPGTSPTGENGGNWFSTKSGTVNYTGPTPANGRQTSASTTAAWGSNGGDVKPNAASLQQPFNAVPPMAAGKISKQPYPDFWCSIGYFELDTPVGDGFKVPSHIHKVRVDGYTKVNLDRFCLGALTNVHRTDASERTRPHIGEGIELELCGEGDVWVKCLSTKAVFVQSYYLDREAGRTPGDVVHKLHPQAYIKVFDLRQCYEQMRHHCASASRATAVQAAAVAGHLPGLGGGLGGIAPALSALSAGGGVGVDDLRRLCILRLSFVKGWGPDYANRRRIEETPCWIEVHLHRALQLCDEVIQTLASTDSASADKHQRKHMQQIQD